MEQLCWFNECRSLLGPSGGAFPGFVSSQAGSCGALVGLRWLHVGPKMAPRWLKIGLFWLKLAPRRPKSRLGGENLSREKFSWKSEASLMISLNFIEFHFIEFH